jgi:hypothetical protein
MNDFFSDGPEGSNQALFPDVSDESPSSSYADPSFGAQDFMFDYSPAPDRDEIRLQSPTANRCEDLRDQMNHDLKARNQELEADKNLQRCMNDAKESASHLKWFLDADFAKNNVAAALLGVDIAGAIAEAVFPPAILVPIAAEVVWELGVSPLIERGLEEQFSLRCANELGKSLHP